MFTLYDKKINKMNLKPCLKLGIFLLFAVFILHVIDSVNAENKDSSKVNSVIIEGAEPTDDEIYEIEIQLEIYIKENPPQYRKPITDISRYKIQYSVIKDKEGKRLIFINGVCKDYWPEVKDWEKELVVVLDGGDCFFNLKFDPSENKFKDFWINGES